ncbi:arylsulfatase [Fuerstiella marisgermanici]|uniref:Arylsulfatase n=1 Tax=Fuerstiella marisgermanici TaxID=1891926 RepID=A0A1P8WR74_9PLAN|nr:arylsulfatase [Fuerstiella marisgermanici]APZ96561.1 Arylsulfatase [Fuerstiella marisgermanici]
MKSLLVFLSALFTVQQFATAAAPKPNIVYILLDDAGYGDLSCYGQKLFTTPHIDRLAAEGMKFTEHYSGSTVCAPTRCSLMTGLHTGHTYVRGNREVKPEGQAAMPADIVTIPRLLKKAGYKTGAFGKWGLGAPSSPSDPAEHFDLFYGYNCQREAHSYYPDHLWRNKQRVPMDGETYTATLIMDEALQFVRDNKADPFFLFLPVTIPHAAMHAPEEYVKPWREKFPQFEDKIGKYSGPEVRNPVAAFAGMMTLMDEGVGDLMALLSELNIDDNTIVLFSSDNGPHKEGGHDPEFFNSNGPLKGHKRDLYEGGIRAPLIARWPGNIEPGTTSALISAHWDMLPTFCELAGVDIPAGLDGISMVSELTGEGSQTPHEFLYWEFYEKGGKRAVRFGNWKAVQQNLTGVNQKDGVELYDLSSDIGEEHNIADDHPDQVKRALEYFAAAHTPSEFWSFGRRKK